MNNQTNETKNWEGKYRILKRRFLETDKKYTRSDLFKYIYLTLLLVCVILFVMVYKKNEELTKENIYLNAENMELVSKIDLYFDTALYFADASYAMDETNANLKEMISYQKEELVAYRSREELFDKYEYALYYGGARTDITYGQIISLQEYCQEKGYSNDMVDLVLAIAMKESTGHEKAYNQSTATGYCQLLDSTAKFVYTKLEGNETYTHDDALDGEKNLKMCADYIDYLYNYHGKSVPKAIDSYRGAHVQSYINTINKYLSNNGLSISDIQIEQVKEE